MTPPEVVVFCESTEEVAFVVQQAAAAIQAALARAGISPQDLALAEIMEAYAVQAMACVAGAGLDPARVNLGGGSWARGHPIGASGAILAVRLFYELQQGVGLAAIAAAGGVGTALLLAR